MTKDIFISYSRRDQEFVTRLASDLNAQVAGVWFDQSTIQLGQKWHDEIMDGIRECKAFVLVLSPDAAESKYVREEVNKALELGKPIFPILYRPGKWTGEFDNLVKEVQTLDLRSGSYTDNFQKLVDGLIEAGAAKATGERPFLRQATTTPLSIVFSKIPGWAFAWSLGWLVFWMIVIVVLVIRSINQDEMSSENMLSFILLLISGAIGGFGGGLVAGLFTMLALRPNAPSISWKHMSPTIRIWGIVGPLGMIISGFIAYISSQGIQGAEANCDNLGIGECFGTILGTAFASALVFVFIVAIVFLLIVIVTWFLTGVFAGWQAVHHIRRLEPGITSRQSRSVSFGWGCGAIVAAVILFLTFGILLSALGLQ
ncbi:MAG TPA: toll/interleukin-1 receptor domain-containing protein [Anaerolineales bacterium]|nr:toll/interleukin-1 receptor domain-containing protein [Anaerolineales bacterium]